MKLNKQKRPLRTPAQAIGVSPLGSPEQQAQWAKEWSALLTAERRAAFLLALPAIDLHSLERGEREQLRARVWACLKLFQMDPAGRSTLAAGPFPDPLRSPFPCPITDTELGKFQSWLDAGYQTLLAGSPWHIHTSVNYRITTVQQSGFWLYETDVDTTPVRMMLRAMAFETLRDARKQIRQCPECHKLFIPRRAQKFCSNYCGQLVRTRRWVERRTPQGD
jgi:hypothetical protein